jgi:Protein of unknown function (DUF3187)
MRTFLAATALFVAIGTAGPAASAADDPRANSDYLGLLRARDLTPFGFLRLDMRPAHAVAAPEGTWAVELELAHQNTWAMTRPIEKYLEDLPQRREIGPDEFADFRALPGENYLVDLELATLDLTIHHRFSSHWGGYLVLSGVSYDGGFLDSSIEQFHDLMSFDPNGREGAARNDINIFADLNSVQLGLFDTPTSGGLLDPTIGLRYSGVEKVKGWNYILEAAAKVATRSEDGFLSTGESDYGVQATLQRFSDHHAWYISGSAVYYDGRNSVLPTEPRVVPTLVVGYERKLSPKTHVILQGYVSDSVYTRDDTELDELLDTKFQLSLGVYRRIGRSVLSFAFTENLHNFNNTPDVGIQVGWAYSPVLKVDD